MSDNVRGGISPPQELIDAVIERMKQDIQVGDWTAIDELLTFVPERNLIGYLPESPFQEFRQKLCEVSVSSPKGTGGD